MYSEWVWLEAAMRRLKSLQRRPPDISLRWKIKPIKSTMPYPWRQIIDMIILMKHNNYKLKNKNKTKKQNHNYFITKIKIKFVVFHWVLQGNQNFDSSSVEDKLCSNFVKIEKTNNFFNWTILVKFVIKDGSRRFPWPITESQNFSFVQRGK